MKKNDRIVITGVAPICGAGIGKVEVWNNILNKKLGLGVKKVVINDELIDEYYKYTVGKIELSDFIDDKYKINELREWKKGKESVDLNGILAAIKLAIEDSELDMHKKVGLLVSHENPGLEDLIKEMILSGYRIGKSGKINFIDYFKKMYDLTEREAYETQSFMLLHHISKVFNIHGYSLITNNACSSGLYGIEAAAQCIRGGLNSAMIVATSDFPQVFKQRWLRDMGLYSEDGKIKPFARDRDGFVLGEGAAAIMLESYESAKRRNARIYAEYLGGCFMLESWKVSLPAINEGFYQTIIRNTLKKCNLENEDISVINAHGLGTQVGDCYEGRAINEVFGSSSPPVAAFKPYVGHTLGGSALIETVILILSMSKQVVPPILNCENVDERLGIRTVSKEMKLPKECFSLKISHSFGGYIGSIALKKDRGCQA